MNVQDPNNAWDFLSHGPEATHQFTWLFGDRGHPRQLPLWAVEPDAPLCIEARAWMPSTSSGRSLLAFWPKHLFLAEREVGTRKLVGRIHRDRLFKKRPSFFQPPRLEE